MGTTTTVILNIVLAYKYVILFPLALFEGSFVALLAGFLIKLNYLSPIISFILIVLGEMIPDSILYFIGRYGKESSILKRRILKNDFISKNFKVIEDLWHRHSFKTMFLGKLSWGFGIFFVITAGLAKIPFKKFFFQALPVTLFKYILIMSFGYLLGHSYSVDSSYYFIKYVTLIFVLILLVSYLVFTRYARKKILEMEKEEERVVSSKI